MRIQCCTTCYSPLTSPIVLCHLETLRFYLSSSTCNTTIILFKQSIHISISFIIYFNLILVLNVHVKILNERKLCPYACSYWIIAFVFRSVLTRVWAFGMLLHESNLFIKTSFKYSPHFFKFAKRMSLIFTNCQN